MNKLSLKTLQLILLVIMTICSAILMAAAIYTNNSFAFAIGFIAATGSAVLWTI